MILSLLQKKSDQEVLALGVSEFPDRVELLAQLTFVKNPSLDELENRAAVIADMAEKALSHVEGAKQALVGGANYFTPMLVGALLERGIEPVFLYMVREFKGVDYVGNKPHGKYKYKVAGLCRPYQQFV